MPLKQSILAAYLGIFIIFVMSFFLGEAPRIPGPQLLSYYFHRSISIPGLHTRNSRDADSANNTGKAR